MKDIFVKYRQPAVVFLIFLVYGLFSSPTPDKIGVAEVLLGILLMISVWPGIKNFFALKADVPLPVRISILYLLIVPLIAGLKGHMPMRDIIRDFVPMCYMLLPVLYAPQIKRNPEVWRNMFKIGILIVAVIFAIRFYILGLIINTPKPGFALCDNDLFLNLDPTVIFSYIYFVCMTMVALYYEKITDFFVYGTIGLFLCSLPFVQMLRLQMVLILFVLILLFSHLTIIYKKWKMSLLLFLCIVNAFIYLPQVRGFFEHAIAVIVNKTLYAGFSNNRIDEIKVVLSHFASSPKSIFLGWGWGDKMVLPTTGNLPVRFVHVGFLYYLWKAGILGFIAIITYWSYFIGRMARVLRFGQENKSVVEVILFMAFIFSFGLFVFIEPGYKILTFYMLLSYLMAYCFVLSHKGREKDVSGLIAI